MTIVTVLPRAIQKPQDVVALLDPVNGHRICDSAEDIPRFLKYRCDANEHLTCLGILAKRLMLVPIMLLTFCTAVPHDGLILLIRQHGLLQHAWVESMSASLRHRIRTLRSGAGAHLHPL